MDDRLKSVSGVFMGMVLILLFTVSSHAAIDSGAIVGAWLFDDGSGGVAADSSGNGIDGELVGGAKWVDGQFGGALEFNGTDAWVTVPEIVPLEKATIIKWFNVTGRAGQWRAFFNHNGWSAGTVHYQFRTDNKMEFCIHSNTNGGRHQDFEQSVFTADNSILDEWHHLAVVYDSTESLVRVYFDGELDIEAEWGANPALFGPGRIGSWDGNGREWQGMLDEVILFNTLLEQEDIQSLMNNGLASLLSVEPLEKLATAWGKVKAN